MEIGEVEDATREQFWKEDATWEEWYYDESPIVSIDAVSPNS